MMRVLVLFGGIPLYGKERANIELFTCLKDVGLDSLFVTHDEYGHENIQPALDEQGLAWTTARWAGRLSLKLSPADWLRRARGMLRGSVQLVRIARAYRPTHLFVTSQGHFLSMWPALYLLRLPLVWHVCDRPETEHPVIRTLWRRMIIPRVSRFVCVSHFIERELLKMGASPDQAVVIYDRPMDRPRPAPDDVFEAPPFDGTTLAYVGQITAKKGVDLLVEVALDLCRERPDFRVWFAGGYDWDNPFAEELVERIRTAGCEDRVQFLGYVEDIPGLLGASDALVCPSRYEEPLGLVVVEAKQAQIPSVIFPSGGLQELVTHGEDGYVCRAKSADALREGIEAMLDAPDDELARLGRAAHDSLAPLGFDRTAFTNAWRDVLERV